MFDKIRYGRENMDFVSRWFVDRKENVFALKRVVGIFWTILVKA